MDEKDNKQIDEIVALLDGFASSEVSRMKVSMSEELSEGAVEKRYHHGRCDIGSPWAKGTAFDVLDDGGCK